MSLEWNKIFAAVLIAGIVAKLTGFVANKAYHVEDLKENAYIVEMAEAAPGEVKKEKVAEPILALLATADLERGKKLSRACAACHSFEKGGENRVGPYLWGTVGAKKGHSTGFAYSTALLEKGGDWNYQSLNKFLWKPKKYIAGTKMNYIGLKKPQDRANMIAWLRTLSDTPLALPTAAEIATEAVVEIAPDTITQ